MACIIRCFLCVCACLLYTSGFFIFSIATSPSLRDTSPQGEALPRPHTSHPYWTAHMTPLMAPLEESWRLSRCLLYTSSAVEQETFFIVSLNQNFKCFAKLSLVKFKRYSLLKCHKSVKTFILDFRIRLMRKSRKNVLTDL